MSSSSDLASPPNEPCEIWAELHRAQMGFLVHDVEPGGAAEQREEVARVVGVDRELAIAGIEPGEDRRHGVGRPFADGGVAGEPGRAGCEAGERGEAHCVDSVLGVEQRVQRKLVEDDQHHRGARPFPGGGGGRRRSGERQLRDIRAEEEEREEEQRHRRQHREHQPGRVEARVDGAADGPAGAASVTRSHPGAPTARIACRTSSPTSAATKNACTTKRARRGITASIASRSSRRDEEQGSAKRTTSSPVEPRAPKNSAFGRAGRTAAGRARTRRARRGAAPRRAGSLPKPAHGAGLAGASAPC